MKYTLIIDGHNFMFRTLYVLPQKQNELLLSSKESQDMFCSKLEQNINSTLNELKQLVDRCIITFDSKSWRNDIESNINYKGTRKQEDINWEGFEVCIKNFMDILNNYNVSISKTRLAEADDLIFMWCNALTNKGIPVIIYTSDKDMLQLVNVNSNSNADVLLWSDVNKKLYVPKGLDSIKKDDIPFLESFAKGQSTIDIYDRFSILEQSIRKNKLEKIETDYVRFIFNKVLVGDKSDNISSVWSYVNNGRTYNVTDAKSDKILNNFVEKTGLLNLEFLYIDDALSSLADSCIEVINNADRDVVLNNIKRNIKYMVLSKNTIPSELIDTMMEEIRDIAKKMKKLDFSKIKMNTEYVIKRSENVLSGIDDTDMSFIKKPKTSLF